VPESVDHVLVRVDPKEDRTWLQSEPAVATDNAHALDKTGAPPLACFQNMQGFFQFSWVTKLCCLGAWGRPQSMQVSIGCVTWS
jgi:hypothetical protein